MSMWFKNGRESNTEDMKIWSKSEIR